MSHCPYDVRPIEVEEVAAFSAQHHYSEVMPRHTEVCYGGFRDGKLVAAISFGWGQQPLATIRTIFPSLTTKDYFDIGKMCLLDEEPKNSAASQFVRDTTG